MRNVALFVVLAVLTVAALVAWNVTSRQSGSDSIANSKPTPTKGEGLTLGATPSPTPETGGALRRIFEGNLFGGNSPITPTPGTPTPQGGSTLGNLSPSITPLPTVTVGPTPIGGYTKGGERVVTPTLQQATPIQASNVVLFNDNGFSPESIRVKTGTMVRFINNSNVLMWIVAENATFDMGQSVGRNGVFEYRFTTTGEWRYVNKNNTSQKGNVIVTQ